MFSVLLAATKFQCDRVITGIIRMARRMLQYMLWMILPETNIAALVDNRGIDTSIDITEKIVDNRYIGMDDLPIDLLGESQWMMILLKDGRCIRMTENGVYENGSKISEVWEPICLLRKKETLAGPLTDPSSKEGDRGLLRVKDD